MGLGVKFGAVALSLRPIGAGCSRLLAEPFVPETSFPDPFKVFGFLKSSDASFNLFGALVFDLRLCHPYGSFGLLPDVRFGHDEVRIEPARCCSNPP